MDLPRSELARIVPTPRKKLDTVPLAATVAAVARRQHGVISRRQLLNAGMSDATINRWVCTGRLHRVHRGVYAVGHVALSREGKWMAAVLAAGTGSALAGASAARLWRISRNDSREIGLVRDRGRGLLVGARIHRTRSLPARDVTVRNGIRVTTVARTIVDLAEEWSVHRLVALMREARFRRVLDVPAVLECSGRMRNRRGHGKVLVAVERHLRGTAGARSFLELRWLALLDAAGVREPEVGAVIDPEDGGDSIEVDNAWRDVRLYVEVDGGDHLSPDTKRKDQERDRRLAAAGWSKIRVTDVDVEREPDFAVQRVKDALRA